MVLIADNVLPPRLLHIWCRRIFLRSLHHSLRRPSLCSCPRCRRVPPVQHPRHLDRFHRTRLSHVWGVAEGGNVIPPDSEAVAYGVLDLASKVVFAAALLWGHRNIDIERLGIHIRDANELPTAPLVSEKKAEAEAAAGVTAPPAPTVEPETV